MSRARGIVQAAALALTAATASCWGHLPPCPAAGGPGWTELAGAHFRLRTDEPADDARGVLVDLERLQAALLFVFGAPTDLDTGRVPAIVVDRGWSDVTPHEVGGYFTHALFQPLIVMEEGGELFRLDVIKHELVHYLSRKIMPRQPRWFAEGIASYYQTLEYDADSGRITVGRPPVQLLRVARELEVATIARVFTATTMEDLGPARFYAAAWLVTHYLMNHRAQALVGYEKALRAGATPQAAWDAAFGAQTPMQLATDVRRYLDGGSYEILLYHMEAPRLAPPVERALSDADVHATRALLYLTGSRMRALGPDFSPAVDDVNGAARRELDEALRQQPDHVMAGAIAHFLLAAPVDVGRATAATRKDAGDWLAWLLLASGLRQQGDLAGWNDAAAQALDAARTDRSVEIHATVIERK